MRTACSLPTAAATRRTLWLSLLVLGLLGGSGPAGAQIVDPSFIATDGWVFSMLERGDTLYLGGLFNWVGERTNGLLALDPVTGADLHGVPPPGPTRLLGNACIADGQGGWFVGGSFADVAGVPRLNVAHLRGDGSLSAWAPRVDGVVYAMAKLGQKLYIGGDFTHVDDVPRSRIAAIDITTGEVLPWNPGANGWVTALAASPTRVFAGGHFSLAGGSPRARLAALDAASGAALPWGTGANYPVNCLALHDSTLHVGGVFNQLGGLPRAGLAAVRASTGEVLGWAPLTSGSVQALAVQDSTLYVGGAFALDVPGQHRNGLAAFDVRTGELTSWAPPTEDFVQNTVSAIAPTPERIHIGGMLAFIGHGRENLLALDPQTGQPTPWKCRAFGNPNALAMSGGRLLACGDLYAVAWAERENLAAVNLRERRVTAWAPRTNDTVMQLLRIGDTIYAAGGFTEAEGLARNSLAAFDAASGALLPWNPQVTTHSATIRIATDGAQVFVGSAFSSLGGQPRNALGAVDLASGLATSWNPGADMPGGQTWITELEVRDSTVYVGGHFSQLGGAPRAYVGAVNARTGLATPWNPTANYVVTDIAPADDFVYVGGMFGTIGGEPRVGIAQLDPVTGQPTPWNPGYFGSALLVAPRPEGVYASGTFHEIGGQVRRGIVLLDPVSGLATDWDPELVYGAFGLYATSLLVRDSSVIVGGDFEYLGRRWSQGLGRVLPRDLQPPFVSVTGPAAGSAVVTWTEQDLSWTAADNQALLSVDLFLSRSGPAGPWEPVAEGLANTGSYRWRVTGPASGDCHVRAVARDLWGNLAEATTGVAFTIGLDPATDVPATAVSRVSLRVRSPIRGPGAIELAFELPERRDVALHVFDLAGRVVARLAETPLEPGRHLRRLPARQLPPGVYIVRLRAGREVRTSRVVLLR